MPEAVFYCIGSGLVRFVISAVLLPLVISCVLPHIVYKAGEVMDRKSELIKIFAPRLRQVIARTEIEYDDLQEIRLRVNMPLMMIYKNKEYRLDSGGHLLTDENCGQTEVVVTPEDIRETMALVSNYSLYAYEDEIRQGYITIRGGHRVGIAGKIILENERIKSIQYISFMNIRLSHQVKGCADRVLPYILRDGRLCHTLIISPPCCGKTTMLRDIIRQVSGGGQSVGVVDERSEIAACYLGIPQNEVGIRTDVLDGCPKAHGMLMLLRSMSPQIIAVDEIGSQEDIRAIAYVINCGCKLLATVHGSSIEDLMSKPVLSRLVREKLFERYIVLNNRGRIGNIEAVYNEFGTNLFFH